MMQTNPIRFPLEKKKKKVEQEKKKNKNKTWRPQAALQLGRQARKTEVQHNTIILIWWLKFEADFLIRV